MSEGFKFEVQGLSDTLAVFAELADQIGDKQSKSKILIPAVKEAMTPVLVTAEHHAPYDTGLLEKSLYLTARRPTKKDQKSIYINPTDSVVAIVSTRNIPRKLKKEVKSKFGHLTGKAFKRARKRFYEEKGIFYDARAVASEFGTANRSAKPFMRISLESQAQSVTQRLGEILRQKMENYRRK